MKNTKKKIDANSYLQECGSDALRDKNNGMIGEAFEDLPNISNEIAKKQAEYETDKKEKEILDKLTFIKDNTTREEFFRLMNSKPSNSRDKAMIEILRDNLQWKVNKAGSRLSILPTVDNLHNILRFDPCIGGLFGYEESREEIVFLRQAYWQKKPCVNLQWTDADDAHLRVYVCKNYINSIKKLIIDDLVQVVAMENSFNVAKNFFENLPKWDGKERAATLFIDFLKVEDTPFARAVTEKWLLAAIARVYFPGCRFQNALVLQGNQHIGKSYILEKLAGVFYGDLISNVDDTHAIDEIRNMMVCEMKEMSAMRKADVNAQKAFIERSFDNYRPAYAKRAQKFLRHCVFAITVNDAEFLRDGTGNRRYWVLKSASKKFEIAKKLEDEYIQQVWAEVRFKFQNLTVKGFENSLLELPLNLKIQAEKVADSFTVDNGLQGEIASFLDTLIPPPVIWDVLTKEEKRSFFKTKSITLDESDWQARKTNLPNNKRKTFDEALEDEKHVVKNEIPCGKEKSFLRITVYGSVKRGETCAVEIYNEFFSGNDKRKLTSKINEILPKLEDWKLADEQYKDFHGYGNQKKIYQRVNID